VESSRIRGSCAFFSPLRVFTPSLSGTFISSLRTASALAVKVHSESLFYRSAIALKAHEKPHRLQ